MCGIVGYAGAPTALAIELLSAMRDAIAHRGPDSFGLWALPDKSVIFGHRRLAILDLSPTGAQPMENARRTTVVVFNGEIYNHDELRQALLAEGAHFSGRSDTEVLLAAYDFWGTRCVEYLRGMFSFAIYDQARHLLYLARDRVGEKPLFWARHRGGVVFASELKALMADPAFPRKLSPDGLAYYLSFGYVPGDNCILQGVNKLPPAHCLTWSPNHGEPKITRYWQPPSPKIDESASAEELTGELHRLLTHSVTEQLVADVPLAVLLSGGVDSSLVTAVASQAAQRPIRTYTVTLPGHPNLDESLFARTVAAHLDTEHFELPLEQSSSDLIQMLAAQYDEPLADSSMIPTYLLAKTVRQHCTVVLGGDGGDELFGGYRSYQSTLHRDRLQGWIPTAIRSLLASLARTLPDGTRGRNFFLALDGTAADSIAQSAIWTDATDYHHVSPWLAGNHLKLDPKSWRRSLVQPELGLPGAAMAADFASYLPDDILVKVDRASMLCSLEVRAPFLDQRIIEFAFGRVPNDLRTTRRDRKILLKSLGRKLLPPQLDLDRKQGFTIPISQWLNPLVLEQWAESCREQIESILSTKIAQTVVHRHRNPAAEHKLYALIMLSSWMRHYSIAA